MDISDTLYRESFSENNYRYWMFDAHQVLCIIMNTDIVTFILTRQTIGILLFGKLFIDY